MRLDLVITRKPDGSLDASAWENEKAKAAEAFQKAKDAGQQAYLIRRAVWSKRSTSEKPATKKVATKKVAKKSAD